MKKFEIIYRCDDDHGPHHAPHDAAEARARLETGNQAFASVFETPPAGGAAQSVIPIDLSLIKNPTGAAEQRPFAAVLSCADARVPTELIFGVGPNDIFTVRVAGNGLGPDVLGSLRYAIAHLGGSLKLIVVLGHSGCGAITAAVDVFLNPSAYLALAADRATRAIVDQFGTAVHASALRLNQVFGEDVAARPGYRKALIETAVITSAAFTAHSLHRALHEDGRGDIQTTYGVYHLDDCRVCAPQSGSDAWQGLANAPTGVEDFAGLADAITRSPRIVSILTATR